MASISLDDDRLQLVPSKYANYMIAFRPSKDADAYYIYRKTKTMTLHDGSKSESYRCRGCEISKGSGFVSTTVMRNGRLVRDPDREHREGCIPLTKIDLEALKLRREMVRRCKEGDDPRDAYEAVMAESAAMFDEDTEGQRLLREKLGSFVHNRSNLNRSAVRNKKELYAHLTSRERRRVAAVAAARKRKELRDAMQSSPYGVKECLFQDAAGEPSVAVQWINPADSPISQRNDQRLLAEVVDCPSRFIHALYQPEHNYTSTSGEGHATANGTNGCHAAVTNTAEKPRSEFRGQARPSTSSPQLTNAQPQPAVVNGASVTDIVKVIEAYRTKSRWESFGDYVAKTLESMTEENAAKAAKEMQEILFRASWNTSK